jgi:hypothetical protein
MGNPYRQRDTKLILTEQPREPSKVASGRVLRDNRGQVIARSMENIIINMNNQAEMRDLIEGIKTCLKLGINQFGIRTCALTTSAFPFFLPANSIITETISISIILVRKTPD